MVVGLVRMWVTAWSFCSQVASSIEDMDVAERLREREKDQIILRFKSEKKVYK